MKILLIEDNPNKAKSIIGHLTAKGVADVDIIHAENMTDFAAFLNYDIGLFIIDFKLPSFDGGTAIPNGNAILEAIIKSGKNDALMIAISSYPSEFPDVREQFEAHGCILSDYKATDVWKSTLDHLLTQLRKSLQLDFLIFCALKEERKPYTTMLNGRGVNRGGIICWDFELSGKKGSIILMPQMGLVNAAIVAATCIDRYKPKIVAMSGICGGFKKQAELGQLIISKMVYEYQSGKWSDEGFQNEPYQVATDANLLSHIDILLDDENLLEQLEQGFRGDRPAKYTQPSTAVFTSGSAVIADEKYLSQIETFHRKVQGLDMEIFAIQRAAELSSVKPVCLCAKTVVDLCNAEKEDKIHLYGSFVSARFVLKALEHYFSIVH